MQKVEVKLKNRPYSVLIGKELLGQFSAILKQFKLEGRLIVITNARVNQLHGKNLRRSLIENDVEYNFLEIPDGERSKNLKIAGRLFDKLAKMQVGRDATIVAFGGGVVGDLAGFVAATYMRGIALIQIPTTLLAQVDSSVGGKTGVDLSAGKNLVGAFYQPKLVLADVNVLETLPHREILNGLAEVVKYAIIKSPEIFKALEKTGADLKGIEAVIGECVRIKAEVVSKDEREISGLRMILNLGHTVGHALETHFGYHVLNHGEAVALGILAETEIARRLKLIGQKDAARIAALIAKLGFATKLAKLPAKKIIHLMQLDKKVRGKKVNYVLPSGIGKTKIVSDPAEELVLQALGVIGGK